MRAVSLLPMTTPSIRIRSGMGRDFNPFASAHVSGDRPKRLPVSFSNRPVAQENQWP